MKITKAVFPVAGLGTRSLPATKAIPKEMLPIVDKPLIQYAVEEAVHAGIKQLIFVTSSGKRALEDHFDKNFELENILQQRNKQELLKLVQNILPKDVHCVYIRQSEQLGLGHAVLCAKEIVDNHPFAVILPDDLIAGKNKSALQQMLEIYENTNSSVIAVEEVPHDQTNKYGIVDFEKSENNKYQKINGLVEKPKVEEAPSNLAIVGRYLLTPEVFHHLETLGAGAIGEIQLTDGIAGLLKEQDVYVCPFAGVRYDCGNKLGYLQANIEYALQHSEIGFEFVKYLRQKFTGTGI